MNSQKVYLMTNRVLIACVAVFAIACLFVTVLIESDHVNDGNQGLIATVLGFGSIILMQLLNANKTAQVQEKVGSVEEKVDRVLNGEMEGKIQKVMSTELDNRGIDKTD